MTLLQARIAARCKNREFRFGRNAQGQFAGNDVPTTSPADMRAAYNPADYAGGAKLLKGRMAEPLADDVQRRRGLSEPLITHPTGAPSQLGRIARAETENVAETVARFLRKKAKLK